MERSYPEESNLDQFARILRSLVAVLGKGLTFRASGKGSFSNLSEDDDLFFLFDREVTLTTEPSPVECRISDLYHLMNLCSISELTFAKDSDVRIWGLSAEEYQRLAPVTWPAVGEIFSSRTLPGMSESSLPTIGDGTRAEPVYTNDGAYGLRFQGTKNFSLQFSNVGFHQYAHGDELLQYLQIFKEISLHPGQTLTIEDSRIYLSRAAHPLLGDMISLPAFALNQMLVHAGMDFEWVSSDEMSIHWKCQRTQLSICPRHPLILRPLVAPQIRTTLELLGHALIHTGRGREFVPVRGGQQIHLFELTGDEMLFFQAECKKGQFRNLFPRQNPTGFVWSLRIHKGFQCRDLVCVRDVDQKRFPFLALIPDVDGGLELALERATGEELIANLVRESHPGLLQELHDFDPAALNFLLFRALMYYCCDDFRFYRTDELPDFFSEDTPEKILSLLKNETFTAQCKKVRKNPEHQALMRRIWLESTAAEFDSFDKTKLPESLQIVFKMVSAIANVGTQKAPLFLTRDLPNFLTKNPVSAAATAVSKATAADDSKDSKK